MNALNVDCATISVLMGQWHDGELPGDEHQAFEEHLLFCPPCLVQNQKLKGALAALSHAARAAAPQDLTHRLATIVEARAGAGAAG